jgi:hypothetical protein
VAFVEQALYSLTVGFFRKTKGWIRTFAGNQATPTGITESVIKLFSAIDELNELFQECLDYVEEIEKQTSDPTIIESNPPSPRRDPHDAGKAGYVMVAFGRTCEWME